MEGFSSNMNDTFTSTRGCAEHMLSMYQLKVKVTVKGQILNKQILDIMFCLLCKSYTNGKNLQSWLSCPCVSSRSGSQLKVTYQLKVKVTIKGQIFNKKILHIMLCPLYNSFTNGRISFKLE